VSTNVTPEGNIFSSAAIFWAAVNGLDDLGVVADETKMNASLLELMTS
jgi:hypothetical protein